MTAYSAAPTAERRRTLDGTLVASAAFGAALTALAVLVVLTSGQAGDQPLIALGSVLAVATPIAVGLWVRQTGHYERFAALLVTWGLVSFLPILSYSSDAVVYSLGRIGVWLVEPVAIAAMLAFPSGRLTTTVDRAIVVGVSATIALLYLPTALLVERYPEPSFWTTCRDACPENAFMVVANEPAFVDAWVRPLRELVVVLAFVAVIVVLSRRVRAATDVARRMLAPVLVVSVARSLTIACAMTLRGIAPDTPALDVLSWLFVLLLPVLALAFAVGLVRSELHAGRAMQRLAFGLRRRSESEDLTELLSSALEDPSLTIAYWLPEPDGRWVDASGTELRLPGPESGRAATQILDAGRPVAAFIHDAALDEQRRFVEAAGELALMALENHRLRASIEASLEELRESHARVQAAADTERRRIERDLHDGAQQRLVALRIRLGLAAETLDEDPELAPSLLEQLAEEVDDALEDVRSLARGIYPALLADYGLERALQAAAQRAPMPTAVKSTALGRYSAAIEATVYFCCIEALQNVAKHAGEARSAWISVIDDGSLRFEVRDDGCGFDVDAPARANGLTNMRDRIDAVGGEITISSAPGAGTRVAGVVPLSRRR